MAVLPVLLDPTTLKAAQRIYRTYFEVHQNSTQTALGVVIDPYTLRGFVILRRKPALLPGEFFVPIEQLE
ncbi:MAG: hypothetical protein SAL07_11890 [Oscillatoria sp. PMC 1051.18]|nr:hypothetical protein [Oscillatoria sp. PMC 1050.18]MEC5030608.1 hypothetical protein [Oscillatoria sp. PMC 1051.18]